MNIKSDNTILQTNNGSENQNKKENFFTVKLLKSGLADMLWQLSILYRISQLSDYTYTYVHTPFAYDKRYKLTLVGKIFQNLENAVNNFIKIDKCSQRLNFFLGLDKLEPNINDPKFINYQIIEVPIHKIYQEDKVSDIHQLKKYFNEYIDSVTLNSKQVIYCLRFTPEMYEFRHAFWLDELLSIADPEDITLKSLKLKLSESYRQAREDKPIHIPFDTQTVKVVVHLRKGDRMLVNLNKKLIRVFSSKVKVLESISDLHEWETKHYANSTETHKAYTLVEKIFSKYGKEKFSVIVISDGYERTFQNIRHAISKGEITFSQEEKGQLEKIERTANKEFDVFSKFPNVFTIIGETEQNTFKSIHAIICADIIVRTAGGFASVLYWLFKNQERYSTIIRLGQDDDQAIDNIGLCVADNISGFKRSDTI